jgi:hypothetical protein
MGRDYRMMRDALLAAPGAAIGRGGKMGPVAPAPMPAMSDGPDAEPDADADDLQPMPMMGAMEKGSPIPKVGNGKIAPDDVDAAAGPGFTPDLSLPKSPMPDVPMGDEGDGARELAIQALQRQADEAAGGNGVPAGGNDLAARVAAGANAVQGLGKGLGVSAMPSVPTGKMGVSPLPPIPVGGGQSAGSLGAAGAGALKALAGAGGQQAPAFDELGLPSGAPPPAALSGLMAQLGKNAPPPTAPPNSLSAILQRAMLGARRR